MLAVNSVAVLDISLCTASTAASRQAGRGATPSPPRRRLENSLPRLAEMRPRKWREATFAGALKSRWRRRVTGDGRRGRGRAAPTVDVEMMPRRGGRRAHALKRDEAPPRGVAGVEHRRRARGVARPRRHRRKRRRSRPAIRDKAGGHGWRPAASAAVRPSALSRQP